MAEILARGERWVGVAKPSGVPVHATRGAVGRPLLQRVRDEVGQYVWPVHRLDAATSGVVLFALDPEATHALSACFAEGRTEKRYYALVRGVPEGPGLIDHPVPRDAGKERVAARTAYQPLFDTGRYAWLALRPFTGRRHQLRRHLKHCSWPIIGDVRYGKGEHNRLFRERYGLHRLALHAARLVLEGPDGEAIDLRAPVPPDLSATLAALGAPPSVLEQHHQAWPTSEG